MRAREEVGNEPRLLVIWLSRIDDEQKCSRPFVLAVDYYDFFYFIDRQQDLFLPWHLTATGTHTYVAYEGPSIKWYVTMGMYNQKPPRPPFNAFWDQTTLHFIVTTTRLSRC